MTFESISKIIGLQKIIIVAIVLFFLMPFAPAIILLGFFVALAYFTGGSK